MKTGSNIRKRSDGRYEARYIKSRTAEGKAVYASCYADSYEAAEEKRNMLLGINECGKTEEKHMNILVLGKGDYGACVFDQLVPIHMYEKIDFLDDYKTGAGIIGRCEDYLFFLNKYPVAIPAFGDNQLRKIWFERLQRAGFIVPILVHPTAIVSPTAKLGQGTVVEARATVNSGAEIGKGCIISNNVTVDVSAVVGDFSYIAPGITVSKRKAVEQMSIIE